MWPFRGLALLAVLSLGALPVVERQYISVYFSPDKENENIVSKFITDAEKEVSVASYSLTNETIAEALREEKARGSNVRVICDKANFKKVNDLCSEVGGKPDKKHGLMHNKFIVRDRKCVLTGSYNFTNNANENNRENFVIICQPDVAKNYQIEFDKLWRFNT